MHTFGNVEMGTEMLPIKPMPVLPEFLYRSCIFSPVRSGKNKITLYNRV